jgi:hypothetical protein
MSVSLPTTRAQCTIEADRRTFLKHYSADSVHNRCLRESRKPRLASLNDWVQTLKMPLGRCCHTDPAINTTRTQQPSRRVSDVFHGSQLSRKDNPRWTDSNAAESQRTPKITYGSRLIPDPRDLMASSPRGHHVPSVERMRIVCAVSVACLIGLPRRADALVHAANDAEACWQHWHVTERRAGLVRWYRDARFDSSHPEQLITSPSRPYPGGC